MTTAADERYTVPALLRGLELLGCFSRQTPTLSGADLARQLGVPRASVCRMLHTLEQTRQNIMMTKNDKSIGAVAHLKEHQNSPRKLTDVGS